MSSSGTPDSRKWPVDVRLVAPESRYEVDEGRLVYVAPSDEPHGSRHSKISALLEAHVAADYDVASDMLTRTSELDDVAPDASVFPIERDPATGGRQLEELAFEVVSTERLSHAARKAQKLSARGVRRVFAIDAARARAFEWSTELGTWQILSSDGVIDDACLAAPLPIQGLVRAAKTDDVIARALLRKQNPVLVAALDDRALQGRAEGRVEGKVEGKVEGRAEGKAEAILAVLDARGIAISPAERERISVTRDAQKLDRWLTRAVTCGSPSELE